LNSDGPVSNCNAVANKVGLALEVSIKSLYDLLNFFDCVVVDISVDELVSQNEDCSEDVIEMR
jgi:hypothetical protein